MPASFRPTPWSLADPVSIETASTNTPSHHVPRIALAAAAGLELGNAKFDEMVARLRPRSPEARNESHFIWSVSADLLRLPGLGQLDGFDDVTIQEDLDRPADRSRGGQLEGNVDRGGRR